MSGGLPFSSSSMSPDESQRGRSDGGGADSPDDGGVYRPFAPGGGRRFPSAPEEVERAAADPGNRKRAYLKGPR